MQRLILTEYQLAAKLTTLHGARTPVYLLFMATRNPDGSRWCPDCTSADPVLDEAFEDLPASAQVFEIQVERARWKGEEGKSHPFRSKPFALKGLPTLIAWEATEDKVIKRFTEGECEQMEMLQDTFRSKA